MRPDVDQTEVPVSPSPLVITNSASPGVSQPMVISVARGGGHFSRYSATAGEQKVAG